MALFLRSLSRTSTIPIRVLGTSTSVVNKQEKILTVPNALCVGRLAMAPYIAHLVINEADFKTSLGLFCVAGVSDLLDGQIARRIPGQMSHLGSFLDPLADKVLAASLFLSLSAVGVIPAALTSLVVSRDLLLIYAGFYIRYMSVEPPFTVSRGCDGGTPDGRSSTKALAPTS